MVKENKDIYANSMEGLKEYLKKAKHIPSEKEWNRYAVEQDLLSAQTISFVSGMGFNKLCRNLYKINTRKKDCK